MDKCIRQGLISLAAFYALAFCTSAQAVQWTSDNGDIDINWDNTISYGAIWRTEDADAAIGAKGRFEDLIRRAQINKNDGNQNFNKGLVSSTVTWTTEIDAVWNDDYGAFVRGVAFYDEKIMHGSHDGGAINQFESGGCGDHFCPETQDAAGSKAEFLDAYIWGNFSLGEMPLTLRLGHQVVQWGESLFVQDGINQINPASLASLRRPGAELREALIPLPMIFGQLELTPSLSVETFYLFDWEASEGNAVGTFLSTHDAFIGDGARSIFTDFQGSQLEAVARAYSGFAYGVDPTAAQATRIKTDRIGDREPGTGGQYGLAFRYFAEELNATEFGFYYLKTHAKKQNAGVVLGDADSVNVAGSAACRTAQQLIANFQPGNSVVDCPQLNVTGLGAAGYTAAEIAGAMNFIGGANAAAFVDSTTYFLNYEADQEILGLSFNTLVGQTSIAGEIAYRKDAAFLAELGDNLIIYNALAAADLATTQPGATESPESTPGQYGDHVPTGVQAGDTVLPNAEEDMINMSLLAIHAFGPSGFLDEFNGVFEVGLSYVAGLDDKRYAAQDAMSFADIPGIRYDGNAGQYLDRSSWGYRVALVGKINNAFSGITLQPSLRFAHDVEGNSVIGGNYVEGRRSSTFGLGGVYNFNWEALAAYTTYFGATDRNQLQDRDHFAFSIKHIF